MGGRMKGKVVLVTGAGRAGGQGEAEAALAAAEGARVVLTDVRDDEGTAAAERIRKAGGNARYLHLDVADEASWAEAVRSIRTTEGALHGLVNNAGVTLRVGLYDTSLADWTRVLSINLTGAFLGTKACGPLMTASGGGSIVNIGSSAAMTGVANTAYGTAKWGLRGLTKSAAMQLAADGIRVNAVHPGAVQTPMMADSAGAMQVLASVTPLGRNGQSSEIARLVIFLLSDEASYITGVDVEADGGMSNAFMPMPKLVAGRYDTSS